MNEDTCAPDIYFPIEIPTREYAGTVLLAVELASQGFSCVIGRKGEISRLMSAVRRKGLIFYKHGRRIHWTENYHSLVGQDPEAGVSWLRFEDFALGTETTSGRTAIYPNARHRAQFCFGPDDYEFLRSQHPDQAGIIHLTGSPRASLWGADGDVFYRDQAEAIKERFGNPIVFTSSGGFEHERYLEHGDKDRATTWAAASGAIGLLERAKAVARETGFRVVVRPHPGESFTAWAEATADEPRITVTSALDLAAWIRASAAIVHAGTSTSALEAACGGVPAISAETEDGRHYLSPLISHRAESQERLLELVTQAAQGQLAPIPDSEAQRLLEQKLLHPLSGAARRIADVIVSIVPFAGPTAIQTPRAGLTRPIKRFVQKRRAAPLDLAPSANARFKGQLPTLDQVERDVESAARIGGHKARCNVVPHGKDLFQVIPPR